MDYTQAVMDKYQEALHYLSLLENFPEKEVLNHLHALSLLGDNDILDLFFEQGKAIGEDSKNPDVKKIGLSLIEWAAEQKHPLASLYLLNQQLQLSKVKYQQHNDYYKLIQQAEKIKVKLQKISPFTLGFDQLLEEVELIIDDRKNFFKDEEKRQK